MLAPLVSGGTRSTLGTQVLGQRKTEPAYGFGSATRDQAAKVFISHEHGKVTGAPPGAAPGPIYDMVPAIGPQVNGAIASAPRFGFGKSTRDVAQKVFISQEHADKLASPDSPGPVYLLQKSIGPQSNGAIRTEPVYGFGTSNREHRSKVFISSEHNTTADYGRASPGPAAPYQLKSSFGMQAQTFGPSPYDVGAGEGVRNGAQPSWVIGTAKRFEADAAASVPGAIYDVRPAVGPQVNGRLKSAPLYGFGTSNREHQAKVFISHEHGKVTGGRDAPGPGQYTVKSLTGNPVVAGHQRSGARWGFGTGKRFTDELRHQKDNPGPGAYVI
jgi:hypothetical protein